MRAWVVGLALVAGAAWGQGHPRDGEIHDADTKAWWHTTEALSGDAMQGRDTGSAAYERAAAYVAGRFRAAGLQAAGDGGTYFQRVPMHQVEVEAKGTSFAVVREGGVVVPLRFLEEVTIGAAAGLPAIDAGLTFRGYCGKDAMRGVAGEVVVCFGTQRAGLPTGGERVANARAAGAVGVMNVDDAGFTIEPPRWPYAYARSVTLAGDKGAGNFPVMRMSVEAFTKVIAGSGQDAAAIEQAGGAKMALASFEVPAKLRVTVAVEEKDLSSPNVLAVLPGSDAKLKDEYVVVAAHLDGYGFGTAVGGDNLYNGTLDDAAYVALLIQFAEDLKAQHTVLKRSVLFCAFTGEEKGLLGSNWYVGHPTKPLAQTVADVNLDQLRPLFPMKILTALAVDDTTLGATARQVGEGMGVEIRADREPERGLLRRADHYPFLKAGVPAIGFIFGYDPGTDAERRYREWYQVRYHRPQDDLTQPVDFEAAREFDLFFYRLVETVADGERPRMLAPLK